MFGSQFAKTVVKFHFEVLGLSETPGNKTTRDLLAIIPKIKRYQVEKCKLVGSFYDYVRWGLK